MVGVGGKGTLEPEEGGRVFSVEEKTIGGSITNRSSGIGFCRCTPWWIESLQRGKNKEI